MHLRKVCSQCKSTVVQVKRSVCSVAMPSHRRKQKHIVLLLHGEPENTMKRRKALLSEKLLVMKERDKDCKASKRASETREQTLHRQEQNQTHMASIRASETFEHTIHRQQ